MHWLRARRTGDWIPAAIVTAGAFAQTVALVLSGRPDAAHPPVEVLAQATVLRGGVEPFIGARALNALVGMPFVLLAVGAAIALAITLRAAVSLPRLPTLTAFYAGGVVLVGGLAATIDEPGTLLTGWGAARYFLPWILAAELVVVAAAARRQASAVVLAVIVGLAVVSDFRLIDPPDDGWQYASGCLGGPAPCVVPIPWSWAIYWPGR